MLEHVSKELNIEDIMYVLEESNELLSKDANEILNFLVLKSLLNYSDIYLKNEGSESNKLDDKLKPVVVGLLNFYLDEKMSEQTEFKVIVPHLKNIKKIHKLEAFIDIAMESYSWQGVGFRTGTR